MKGGIRTLHVTGISPATSPFFGQRADSGVWRDSVWQQKVKLSALNVIVSEHGKTASVTLVTEKCSDIIAETVDTGIRAELQCLHQTSLFLIGWW
jgi:hypothetical protein